MTNTETVSVGSGGQFPEYGVVVPPPTTAIGIENLKREQRLRAEEDAGFNYDPLHPEDEYFPED